MKKIFTLLLLGCIPMLVQAQNVRLDPGFGTSGIVITPNIGYLCKTTLCPDRKIIGAGYLRIGNRKFKLVVARYNTDGSLDVSFGINGLVYSDSSYIPYALAVQSDGKIIVGGEDYLVRYTAEGKPDNTFGTSGIVRGTANTIKLMPNGQILAGSGRRFMKLNANGSTDMSFGNNGEVEIMDPSIYCEIYEFALLNDGHILVCGFVDDPFNNPKTMVAKFKADGKHDLSFGVGGKVITDFKSTVNDLSAEWFSEVNIVDGGRVLLGGAADTTTLLMQLLPDGRPDPDFGMQGVVRYRSPYAGLEVQRDGKILVGGADTSAFVVSRFLRNGQLDTSFNGNGYGTFEVGSATPYATSLRLQRDGKLVIASTSRGNNRNFVLARLIIDEENQSDDLIIYPNPFDAEVWFSSSTEVVDRVVIYDITGRRIKEVNHPGDSVTLRVAAGVYTFRVLTESGKECIKKMVKL